MASDHNSPVSLPGRIAAAAHTLPDPDAPAFADAFDELGQARIVLLGEASHGTSEFYRARAAITRRLIERHGFTIVAVEADWPDAAQIDAVIRGGRRPSSADGPPFKRFPTWMWRNHEVGALVDWMRDHNARLADPTRQAGFFGLDLYSLGSSIAAVLDYLDRVDPDAAGDARRRYGCMEPWQRQPEIYGHLADRSRLETCEGAVIQVLRDLLDRRLAYLRQDGTEYFDAAQNARVVAAAESYYRSMMRVEDNSWNLRDTHMADTLDALLSWHKKAKAVVWAHNSHLGDARETGMAARGEINLGQLCRERHGDAVRIVGFGTHSGTVAAADDWDQPMRVMTVQPSHPDSVERLFHDSGVPRLLLRFEEDRELAEALAKDRLERFIGVIYRPATERWSHYYHARLSRQFDRYVFFDETRAVTPLPDAVEPVEGEGPPETFPFGL